MPLPRVALLAFVAVITMVNPLAVIPQFVAITHGVNRRVRAQVALIAGMATTAVLLVFLLFGNYVFRLFGITVPAFQIMGGIIFLSSALRTLVEDENSIRTVRRSPSDQETADAEIDPSLRVADPEVDAASIAVVPLAIPMLSGPGAITSVMVLVNLYGTFAQKLALITAIVAVGMCSYLVLLAAIPLSRLIGDRGRLIFSKIMALLLGAIGVQFMVNGIRPLMIEMIKAGQ
ncbi:MAG: MarC family protein [Acidobacteriota bacterium]